MSESAVNHGGRGGMLCMNCHAPLGSSDFCMYRDSYMYSEVAPGASVLSPIEGAMWELVCACCSIHNSMRLNREREDTNAPSVPPEAQ
jgi:hypothetical protein